MGTTTRPELSEKNKWWIGKHRYYELQHFCMQYPEWKSMVKEIDGIPGFSPGVRNRVVEGKAGDPTPIYAAARVDLMAKITMIEQAARDACEQQEWYGLIVDAVTIGISFDKMEAKLSVTPVSRGEWYKVYRKFFWLLDKMRD